MIILWESGTFRRYIHVYHAKKLSRESSIWVRHKERMPPICTNYQDAVSTVGMESMMMATYEL